MKSWSKIATILVGCSCSGQHTRHLNIYPGLLKDRLVEFQLLSRITDLRDVTPFTATPGRDFEKECSRYERVMHRRFSFARPVSKVHIKRARTRFVEHESRIMSLHTTLHGSAVVCTAVSGREMVDGAIFGYCSTTFPAMAFNTGGHFRVGECQS